MRLYTRFRVAARFVRRWLTGARFTVPLPDDLDVYRQRVRDLMRAVTPRFAAHRRVGNRDLLTGMVVALTCGPLPRREAPFTYGRAPRSGLNHNARRSLARARAKIPLVGQPLVTRLDNERHVSVRKPYRAGQRITKKYRVGSLTSETQFRPGYVTRSEQLEARRLRKAATLLVAGLSVVLTMQARGQAWRPALTGAAVGLVYEDVAQSIWAQAHGANESNPVFFSKHPPTWAFVSAGVVSAALNVFAPKKARPWINGATVLLEAFIVIKDARELPTTSSTERIGWRWVP